MIYQIVMGRSTRFIRAVSAQAARVRAFKAFGRSPDKVAPYQGAIGAAWHYDQAAHTMEAPRNSQGLRAMAKGGDASWAFNARTDILTRKIEGLKALGY